MLLAWLDMQAREQDPCATIFEMAMAVCIQHIFSEQIFLVNRLLTISVCAGRVKGRGMSDALLPGHIHGACV